MLWEKTCTQLPLVGLEEVQQPQPKPPHHEETVASAVALKRQKNKEAVMRYRQRHPERKQGAEYWRKYNAEHREERNRHQREYLKRHTEQRKEYNKKRASTPEFRAKRSDYIAEWYWKNPDKKRQYYKSYMDKHGAELAAWRKTEEGKAYISEVNRRQREKRKEEFAERQRKWHAENKAHIAEYRKNYGPRRRELYHQRKEEICARKRELAHTEEYRATFQRRAKRYRETNIQFALKDRIRASINRVLRRKWVKKSKRTMEMVGCSVEELKAHIESQFVNGMSWATRKTWHIDHYVPIAAFDLTVEEEQKAAFNWRNLRPLAKHENHAKSDTIPDPLPAWLPVEIQRRIKERVI